MNTLRELDYSAGQPEILARLKRTRAALELRQNRLSEFQSTSLRHQEEGQINYLDGLLKWLQFGGELPFWVMMEESRIESERVKEL